MKDRTTARTKPDLRNAKLIDPTTFTSRGGADSGASRANELQRRADEIAWDLVPAYIDVGDRDPDGYTKAEARKVLTLALDILDGMSEGTFLTPAAPAISVPEAWDNATIQAVMAALPDQTPHLNADERRDAARFLTACCMATDPAGTDHMEVKAMLSGFRNGHGVWLRAIADAIMDADIPASHREFLYGAFRMGESFLFDIEVPNSESPGET